MNKYELCLDDVFEVEGRTLYRIRALKDFNDVESGELGGYVEGFKNLSQEGSSWVYDDAKVFDDAKVQGNAWVSENAKVYRNAMVYGNAWVYGNGEIYDNAKVYGKAQIYSDACIHENAKVYGEAQIYGDACVHGNAKVYGNARVYGDACIHGNAKVYGNAWVYGDAQVFDSAEVENEVLCTHIWALDHWYYFNNFYRNLHEGLHREMVFPAKCSVCQDHKTFNKEEWINHVSNPKGVLS